ncbi:MAG: RNA polymerase sigma factor [Chitinophagales bacterium]
MTETQLIAACKKGNRKAQRVLYERYAAKMFGVCRRYVHNESDVEDTLLNAFYKVFKHIHTFEEKGSFEGWIRRIVVNESLMFLRKKKRVSTLYVEFSDTEVEVPTAAKAQNDLQEADILKLLDDLPDGYRTIFNLYAIEGYKHREIAEMLKISINTSKSQLIKARKMLRDLLESNSEYRVA